MNIKFPDVLITPPTFKSYRFTKYLYKYVLNVSNSKLSCINVLEITRTMKFYRYNHIGTDINGFTSERNVKR